MAILTPGQIFLADNREVTTTDKFQRFNYPKGEPSQAQRLTICEDIFLAAQKEMSIEALCDGYMIIVPITGALDIICGGELPLRVDAGEVHICYKRNGEHCTLVNQYEADLINFLHFHLEGEIVPDIQYISQFDIEKNPGQLIKITGDALPFNLSIGMFGGREETLYQLKPGKTFFALVVAGAFEVQGRLLHQRDALALWGLPEADLEALSNNAVILVMEV